MATLREIRQRISGVKSTQKITKAMKMVAAAKLRRAQDGVIAARPYARKMRDLLQHLAVVVDVTAHPLFVARPVEKVAMVVVSADRGLCGAFNTNILKAASTHIQESYGPLQASGNLRVVTIGKKATDFFAKNRYAVGQSYIGIYGTLDFGKAQGIMTEIIAGFMSGGYDRVDVVYNEFRSIIQQRVVIEQLLPIPHAPAVAGAGQVSSSAVDYIYEPSSADIVAALVPKHLNFQMWRILLESNAAEQGARMTAMDNATTNASDLIRDLQLSYNKARQSSITKELLEIVSGAEALKSST
jgi:F-type H+-transporting ATPase subunit gamma